MVASTGTLRIEEAFLSGEALPPPPTRHALFLIVIALAALIHLGSIGIGDLYSETEGQYAAAAREMMQSGQYFLPTNESIPRLQKPPLLYWLIIVSYKIFGVSAAAARVPIALSIIATTALTFMIGERLAGYWRGFAAALIYLTCGGTFIFGRIVMPEPLFGAFIAVAIYCGLAGFQNRKRRRRWFAGFWIFGALSCLTKAPHGILLAGGTFALLSIFYREARQRFRALLWWPYVLLFTAIVAPWYAWMETHFNGSFHSVVASEWTKHLLGRYPNGISYDDVPRWQFLLSHFVWLFPWIITILPALFSWRRVIRPREISFNDALPMAWAAVVFLPVLLIGQRQDYYALPMFSAFALFAAMILERASARLRILGATVVAACGIVLGITALFLPRIVSSQGDWGEMDFRWTAWKAIADMSPDAWLHFRPLLGMAAIALLLGPALTIYLLRRHREQIAVTGLAAAMVIIGFCLINGVARIAPYFSLAETARVLNGRLGEDGQVLFEGPPSIASSLGFYLERKFALVNQEPDPRLPLTPEQRELFLQERDVLALWPQSHLVVLIVEQDRVNYWRELLTRRFHIYHQIAVSGTYVVLSNQL